MDELWRPAVAVALVGGAALWLVMAWASRRRKRVALLGPVAVELGLKFHGDSFRGRIRGHAVRGDAGDVLPGRGGGGRGSLLAPFSFGASAVRIRVELSAPGSPAPDGPKALAAVRRELKNSSVVSGGAGPQVALHGTEIVFVLRGDDVDAYLARRAVETAIEAAKPD